MIQASHDEATETLLDEAEASIDRGDPETALQLCVQALEITPGHPGAHFVRGDAFAAAALSAYSFSFALTTSSCCCVIASRSDS